MSITHKLIAATVSVLILVSANAAAPTTQAESNPLALTPDEVVVTKPVPPKVATTAAVQAPTMAAPPTPPAPSPSPTTTMNPSFRQLDELRSQNAILAELVKGAELKSKLSGQGPTLGQPGGASVVTSAPAFAQVQMVSGMEDDLSALISLPSGASVTARVGDNVPGEGVVKSIARRKVVVANKSQIYSLPFAKDALGSSMGGAR